MANIDSSRAQNSSNPLTKNRPTQNVASSFGGMHLVDEKEAAAMLKKPTSWMQMSRHRGDGPPYLKLGRAVRYDMVDLIAWVKAQKRTSTSQG